MNSLIRRGLINLLSQQPCYLQQRVQPLWVGFQWRPGNKNLYKRRPKVKTLHWEKAKLMAVLKPIRPDPNRGKPMWETCGNVTNPDTGEPPLTKYEEVLRNELVSRLTQTSFVGVLTCGPVPSVDIRRCRVYLGQKKMFTARYTKRVLRAGLLETEYENLLQLFDEQSLLVFCKEPNLKDMLNVFKKYQHYTLLGGFMEGRILSRRDIDEYAKLPGLEIARAQFVSLLNSASAQLLRTLGTSQSVLISHLESRAEELNKDSPLPGNSPSKPESQPEDQETKSLAGNSPSKPESQPEGQETKS